jgi:hypothetical protein
MSHVRAFLTTATLTFGLKNPFPQALSQSHQVSGCSLLHSSLNVTCQSISHNCNIQPQKTKKLEKTKKSRTSEEVMGGLSEEATKKVSFDWMRTGPDYFFSFCVFHQCKKTLLPVKRKNSTFTCPVKPKEYTFTLDNTILVKEMSPIYLCVRAIHAVGECKHALCKECYEKDKPRGRSSPAIMQALRETCHHERNNLQAVYDPWWCASKYINSDDCKMRARGCDSCKGMFTLPK